MSTKNIALDAKVYERLSRSKMESESFSKAIDRMLRSLQSAHTGQDILSGLNDISELSEAEAAIMRKTVEQNRSDERWPSHDMP